MKTRDVPDRILPERRKMAKLPSDITKLNKIITSSDLNVIKSNIKSINIEKVNEYLNKVSTKSSPTYIAVLKDNADIIKILKKAGLNFDVGSREDLLLPMGYALQCKKYNSFNSLVKLGAKGCNEVYNLIQKGASMTDHSKALFYCDSLLGLLNHNKKFSLNKNTLSIAVDRMSSLFKEVNRENDKYSLHLNKMNKNNSVLKKQLLKINKSQDELKELNKKYTKFIQNQQNLTEKLKIDNERLQSKIVDLQSNLLVENDDNSLQSAEQHYDKDMIFNLLSKQLNNDHNYSSQNDHILVFDRNDNKDVINQKFNEEIRPNLLNKTILIAIETNDGFWSGIKARKSGKKIFIQYYTPDNKTYHEKAKMADLVTCIIKEGRNNFTLKYDTDEYIQSYKGSGGLVVEFLTLVAKNNKNMIDLENENAIIKELNDNLENKNIIIAKHQIELSDTPYKSLGMQELLSLSLTKNKALSYVIDLNSPVEIAKLTQKSVLNTYDDGENNDNQNFMKIVIMLQLSNKQWSGVIITENNDLEIVYTSPDGNRYNSKISCLFYKIAELVGAKNIIIKDLSSAHEFFSLENSGALTLHNICKIVTSMECNYNINKLELTKANIHELNQQHVQLLWDKKIFIDNFVKDNSYNNDNMVLVNSDDDEFTSVYYEEDENDKKLPQPVISSTISSTDNNRGHNEIINEFPNLNKDPLTNHDMSLAGVSSIDQQNLEMV